jgi:hypothetical protein
MCLFGRGKEKARSMRNAIVAAILALASAASAAKAADSEFLFEVLHKPAFHASWEKLLKDVEPTPDWLLQFKKNYDGVTGELVNETIDGKPYTISFVCEPKDCLGHRFVILFEADGARAFGALGGKDNSPAFFGAPNQAEQDAMSKAVKGDKPKI